jgi:hypothetical protein
VAQATFEQKVVYDYLSLYNQGHSISELCKASDCSYTHMRNMLLKSGVKFRNKQEAAKSMITRHSEWKNNFIKYIVSQQSSQLSDSKIKLLFFVFTEGCIHKSKIQFTNNQVILRDSFSILMKQVYGVKTKTTNRIVAYVNSMEIAKDLAAYNVKASIPQEIMSKLIQSKELTRQVLRIFVDTEGSVIISVRKPARNYTVADRRVVIACTNEKIKLQLVNLLASIEIIGHVGKVGVLITDQISLREFDKQVGFSSGVKVVRKKAGYGLWYNYEKALLLKLLIRIYDEQKIKGNRGKHIGVFMNCKVKEEVIEILNSWYNQQRGEETLGTSNL